MFFTYKKKIKKFAKNLQSYEAAKASFRMKFWIFGYFWPKIGHISAKNDFFQKPFGEKM